MDHLPTNCFIFAGEQSGDLLGSHLLQALRSLRPLWHFTGVGGPKMRTDGFSPILNMEDFQVMGLTDVLLALPKLWKQFYLLVDEIMARAPALCVLIDYPGFNLRLATALRKRGYKGKIVQYVSPTVWAHGKKRIDTMVKTLDLLLVLYPFEVDCFRDNPLRVHYVGHPLLDILSAHVYAEAWWKDVGMTPTEHLIALFPGSRKQEIIRNLPKQLEAAKLMQEVDPRIRFGLSVARPELRPLIMRILDKSALSLQQDIVLVPSLYSYELMRNSRTAIAKAGTVTLELALHKCPTVVVYEISWLNRLYAKYLLRLKLSHFSLVNIIGNKSVFPELIVNGFTADGLCRSALDLHREGSQRHQCIADCQNIAQLLQNEQKISASENAARAIIDA